MSTQPKPNIPIPALWAVVIAFCLLVILIMVVTRSQPELIEPKIISSSPQGQHVQMPFQPSGNWQRDYVTPPSATREQVLQRLSEIRARYKQLRPEIRVSAQPGAATGNRVARQLADALAHYNLGQLESEPKLPTSALQLEGAVILRCAEADQRIARELLGALAPYLTGRVFIRFDEATAAHRMQLYLIGTPWFDQRGLVTFEPQPAEI